MRVVTQIISLCLTACAAFPNTLLDGISEGPIYTNTIHRFVNNQEVRQEETIRPLKKVFLSNRSVTCNDGSPAGFYLRKSYTSKKWIVFLEGGWYCYDHQSCRNRWFRQRHYMTSSQWPETRDVGGILSSSLEENPFWWNANHVFVPYCTSDSWSGSTPKKDGEIFSFMGSIVVREVVRDLVPLGLENSTDLLLTGSSAGGTGVMINLDPIHELLHDNLNMKHIVVKGVTDSGWFLDRTPFAPHTGKPTVDAIRKGMDMWQGKVPRRCREKYIDEPWRCYFGYRIYPTLKSPLFVFQWLFDEAQMESDNVGAPVSKQQWDYIHKMGDALRQSFENVTAVFAPSCISHSILTKRDWQNVKIDDITIAEALHCWEQKQNRRRIKRRKNHYMFSDQPRLKRRRKKKINQVIVENNNMANSTVIASDEEEVDGKRRRNKKQKKNRKRRRKDRLAEQQATNSASNQTTYPITSNTLNSLVAVRRQPNSSTPRKQMQQKRNAHRCIHRRLERCSWPQCNHSCPRLHNPVTGEEMDFIELLKSFGLDMERVADALGIDMQTLNNMDQSELLNLLTQHSN